MAHLKNLIVNGVSRFIGKAYGAFVGTFEGNLVGNADTATKVNATAANGGAVDLAFGTMAANDYARIRVGGKDDNGWLEIATSDGGNESIYVRQYAGAYDWINGRSSTVAHEAVLLDSGGNTKFPGTVTAPNFNGNASSANTAKLISPFENATDNTFRNVWFSDSGTNNKACYNANIQYNPATNILKAGTFQGTLNGTAANTTTLNNRGNRNPAADGTKVVSGLNLYKVYNNGYPTSYGNVLSIGGTGGGEILAGWSGADAGMERLYYRNQRDTGTLAWSAWKTVAYTDDISNYAPSKTGNGASGTWPISISGNAAGLSGSLNFPNIGDVATSNKISWNGSTDGADIYYQTTASDQGNLVLNLRDDANCYLRIAYNGAFKSYFTPTDGNFHGNVNGKSDSAGSADTSAAINYSNIGTNYIKAGSADTGDAANQTANMVIGSWYGITFYDVCGNKIAGGMNVRNGSLTMKGTITGSKVYNAVYNDYAEFFEKDKDTAFEAGDIVALDTSSEEERYIKATEDSIVVVGVCTQEYAHIIGGKDQALEENEKEFVPVSLMGRVHVKVDDTVKRGDKVTASKVPGIGRKAMPGEHSIGTALTNPSNGKVRVLINL